MPQRLGDDVADRHARIERGIRVLEDHLHAAAQRAAARASLQSTTSLPSKRTRAGGAARADEISRRPSVDLPQPDSPTRPSVSPRATVRARRRRRRAPCRPGRCRAARRRTGKLLGQAARRRAASVMPRLQRTDARRARGSAPTATSGGVARRGRRRRRSGQRGAKRQPAGIVAGAGDRARDRRRAASPATSASRGIAAQQAARVGMRGARRIASTGAVSTTRPAYMTTTRSAISATTPRSCVMNRMRHAVLAPAGPTAGPGSAPGW